ncbi:hypothetical protein O181_117649 [Austropuccinia psidii MF-1]|uniref:Uncharacterized protein n=1 Tax=Austropuccinia psidii MF-1 TaxID=1389203 RepID=A0A9Q3KB44_9BASI|nr:hypothetical protein [Austropuccinia psidii MF-1]
MSPVIPTFWCPNFPKVQSPVADVPSNRGSLPSVNDPPSPVIHRMMSNDTMEGIQPEVNSSHSEELVSEKGPPQQHLDASHSFETVLDLGVFKNARTHLDDSVYEIEVTKNARSPSPQKFQRKYVTQR